MRLEGWKPMKGLNSDYAHKRLWGLGLAPEVRSTSAFSEDRLYESINFPVSTFVDSIESLETGNDDWYFPFIWPQLKMNKKQPPTYIHIGTTCVPIFFYFFKGSLLFLGCGGEHKEFSIRLRCSVNCCHSWLWISQCKRQHFIQLNLWKGPP